MRITRVKPPSTCYFSPALSLPLPATASQPLKNLPAFPAKLAYLFASYARLCEDSVPFTLATETLAQVLPRVDSIRWKIARFHRSQAIELIPPRLHRSSNRLSKHGSQLAQLNSGEQRRASPFPEAVLAKLLALRISVATIVVNFTRTEGLRRRSWRCSLFGVTLDSRAARVRRWVAFG